MTANTFPSPKELILNTPLYKKIPLTDGTLHEAATDFLFFAGTYDNFCFECNEISTFQVVTKTRTPQFSKSDAKAINMSKLAEVLDSLTYAPAGTHQIEGRCARSKGHQQFFIYYVDQQATLEGEKTKLSSSIQKIGQYPAFGDSHNERIKKFQKVLPKDQMGELKRAIHLASHDVGVGSYVYLRRIFEGLIEEAHQIAAGEPTWDESAFNTLRMADKIKALKSNLPSFLTENASMYSLLSKGIHEMSEKDCLTHFEALRIAIEIILEEKLEKKERAQLLIDAKEAINMAISSTK
ncbi:MAG: hypothetical protein Q7V20_09120 [Aquabacterium sp.]|uniref:hypothetical protein n=1 Tax=Aquabacterium sp. TaxID=1872578 RepID=UPI00271C50F7|nr:hypothetical protein [Aquabacterium sp.]MDO9003598.1 hypothetical protein [Aquabacterium sp.]